MLSTISTWTVKCMRQSIEKSLVLWLKKNMNLFTSSYIFNLFPAAAKKKVAIASKKQFKRIRSHERHKRSFHPVRLQHKKNSFSESVCDKLWFADVCVFWCHFKCGKWWILKWKPNVVFYDRYLLQYSLFLISEIKVLKFLIKTYSRKNKKEKKLHDDENTRKVKLKNYELGERGKFCMGVSILGLRDLLLATQAEVSPLNPYFSDFLFVELTNVLNRVGKTKQIFCLVIGFQFFTVFNLWACPKKPRNKKKTKASPWAYATNLKKKSVKKFCHPVFGNEKKIFGSFLFLSRCFKFLKQKMYNKEQNIDMKLVYF